MFKKGHKYSEEIKRKISLALKGIKRDDDFKKKISIATKKAMNRDDVKKKMKNVYDQIRNNDEFKEKISIGTKKAMKNPDVKEKMRQSKLGKVGPRLGIKHTEKTKRKIRKICTGKNQRVSLRKTCLLYLLLRMMMKHGLSGERKNTAI